MTTEEPPSEREQLEPLLARLREGRSVALMSDAGTPLVSDPGFRLVRAAHAATVSAPFRRSVTAQSAWPVCS